MAQVTLGDSPYRNSGLFSGYDLDERVQDLDEWEVLLVQLLPSAGRRPARSAKGGGYELYGLTDEEVGIVEDAVAD